MRVACLSFLTAAALLAPATLALAQDRGAGDAAFVNPLDGVGIEQLGETVARPLFSPTRRPPAPEPPVAAPVAISQPQPAALPDMRLLGVLISDAARVAILEDGATGKALRVRSTQKIGDWTVTVIDPVSVSLSSDGREHVHTLFVKGAGKRPPSGRENVAAEAPKALWR